MTPGTNTKARSAAKDTETDETKAPAAKAPAAKKAPASKGAKAKAAPKTASKRAKKSDDEFEDDVEELDDDVELEGDDIDEEAGDGAAEEPAAAKGAKGTGGFDGVGDEENTVKGIGVYDVTLNVTIPPRSN